MKVILKETIDSLGIVGSTVKVKPGYARNYLLPQGKAVQDTLQNRKLMEHQKIKVELQVAKEKEQAQEIARRLEGVACRIAVKVSDEKRLYGSIKAGEILEALAAQQITLEKRMLVMPEPIKELGVYRIPIRVYKGVEPEITVEVVAEEKKE